MRDSFRSSGRDGAKGRVPNDESLLAIILLEELEAIAHRTDLRLNDWLLRWFAAAQGVADREGLPAKGRYASGDLWKQDQPEVMGGDRDKREHRERQASASASGRSQQWCDRLFCASPGPEVRSVCVCEDP